jgi:hypothetical protein
MSTPVFNSSACHTLATIGSQRKAAVKGLSFMGKPLNKRRQPAITGRLSAPNRYFG